jgi:hypothetical protein
MISNLQFVLEKSYAGSVLVSSARGMQNKNEFNLAPKSIHLAPKHFLVLYFLASTLADSTVQTSFSATLLLTTILVLVAFVLSFSADMYIIVCVAGIVIDDAEESDVRLVVQQRRGHCRVTVLRQKLIARKREHLCHCVTRLKVRVLNTTLHFRTSIAQTKCFDGFPLVYD